VHTIRCTHTRDECEGKKEESSNSLLDGECQQVQWCMIYSVPPAHGVMPYKVIPSTWLRTNSKKIWILINISAGVAMSERILTQRLVEPQSQHRSTVGQAKCEPQQTPLSHTTKVVEGLCMAHSSSKPEKKACYNQKDYFFNGIGLLHTPMMHMYTHSPGKYYSGIFPAERLRTHF
jgi:hypothetical protein